MLQQINQPQRIDNKSNSVLFYGEEEQLSSTPKTIYHKKEELKNKKLFYLRLAIMLAFVNLLIIMNSFGQLVTVNGVNITNSAQITIKGDVLNNAGATIKNNELIEVSGNFTNNSGSNLFGTSTGNVKLNGANQNLSGTDVTLFHDLSLEGTGTKTLQQNILVGGNTGSNSGVLELGTQILDLNSKELTVTNSSNSAITRNTGFIVSETDPSTGYGILKWNVKNSTGNYSFPFGNATTNSYIPVNFEVNSPGTGTNGYISVGTYPTTTSALPNNRPLPSGLTSLVDNFGMENAQNVVDRWWVMDVANYTTKPVSSIMFTYCDSEWDNSGGSTNNITESDLKAQSHDGNVWNPLPVGTVNTPANTVLVPSTNMFNPFWTIVGSDNPLPVSLLTFDAALNKEEKVDLDWVTATEVNNDYFTLEKSKDAVNFTAFDMIAGAGNSTNMLSYHAIDKKPFEGITYYRLKQTDFDGHFSYSEIKAVKLEKLSGGEFTVYPNPAVDHFFVKFDQESAEQFLFIIDMNGKVLREIAIAEAEVMGAGIIKVDSLSLSPGVYFVSTTDGKMQKLVIQ